MTNAKLIETTQHGIIKKEARDAKHSREWPKQCCHSLEREENARSWACRMCNHKAGCFSYFMPKLLARKGCSWSSCPCCNSGLMVYDNSSFLSSHAERKEYRRVDQLTASSTLADSKESYCSRPQACGHLSPRLLTQLQSQALLTSHESLDSRLLTCQPACKQE